VKPTGQKTVRPGIMKFGLEVVSDKFKSHFEGQHHKKVLHLCSATFY
jgi:hypothetical protein